MVRQLVSQPPMNSCHTRVSFQHGCRRCNNRGVESSEVTTRESMVRLLHLFGRTVEPTMTKKFIALFAIACATGCSSTGPTEVGLGEEFELAPHQSARITGTTWTVAFRGVAEDTRCPLEVACVVSGAAGIQLDIFGTNAENPVLVFVESSSDRWSDHRYGVRAVGLAPSRMENRIIQPEDYRVRLVVEELGP